MKKTQNN